MLLFHHQPTHQPFRAPPLRGLHAYHIFEYIRKQRRRRKKKKILNDKKRLSSLYHSHHQRTKILPVLKDNIRQKKGGKRTSCYTEVLYLGTWKQGCFHTFSFSFFQRLCILHWYIYIFCAAWISAFLRLGWSVCVCLSPEALALFSSWLQLSIMGSS